MELWHGGERPTASRLASELPPDSVQVLTQVALLDLPFSNEAQAIADAETRFLHLPRLNRRLDEARRRLVEAETAGDADEVQRLNAALQALCQERLRLMRRR